MLRQLFGNQISENFKKNYLPIKSDYDTRMDKCDDEYLHMGAISNISILIRIVQKLILRIGTLNAIWGSRFCNEWMAWRYGENDGRMTVIIYM